MDTRMNKATQNRPGGKRVIDAPLVFIDLPHYLEELQHEPAWEKNDRNAITIFKSEGITLVLTALRKDAVLDDLSKEGTILLQVMKGKMAINDKNEEIGEGQMLTIHQGQKTLLKSLQETVVLLTVVKDATGQVF